MNNGLRSGTSRGFWKQNIQSNSQIIHNNAGLKLAVVVSGNVPDQDFWHDWFVNTRGDVFRHDGKTEIISTVEPSRKGNFLGGLQAWLQASSEMRNRGFEIPEVAIMSMVFGEGKRLSPFTQALGNRKPAFPTPRSGKKPGSYLTMADLANLSSARLAHFLQESGFRGLIMKWGDEVIIPGIDWTINQNEFQDVDAVRFVWRTEPSSQLAREKDWVLIDRTSGNMSFQFARQNLQALRSRMTSRQMQNSDLAVNLGSAAISYKFLEIASDILKDDIDLAEKWIDWDPYVWIALFCTSEAQWEEEVDYESRNGFDGIGQLLQRYPDFYQKISAVRHRFEHTVSRSLRVIALDYGEPHWIDWGLHRSLRVSLESLIEETEMARATRELFNIPHERDRDGNILVHSSVHPNARISNSLLINTIITDADSKVNRGILVGGRHRLVNMPHGGCALFCAVNELNMLGEHGVAFRSIGDKIEVKENGRHTVLCLKEGLINLVSDETIHDYGAANFSNAILDNEISFAEAANLVAAEDVKLREMRWYQYWNSWSRKLDIPKV